MTLFTPFFLVGALVVAGLSLVRLAKAALGAAMRPRAMLAASRAWRMAGLGETVACCMVGFRGGLAGVLAAKTVLRVIIDRFCMVQDARRWPFQPPAQVKPRLFGTLPGKSIQGNTQ